MTSKLYFIFLFFLIAVVTSCVTQVPAVSGGKIQRIENFESKYIQSRTIEVWLPANYSYKQKYAVLYMQDGQMLFDSTTTWNRQEWKADETVSGLLQENKIKDVILVAIPSNGAFRHTEYFPQKPLAFLPATVRDSVITQELQHKPQADNYLLFLTKELKPFIDATFSTLPDQQNTFIAGSSMGGLIALYAICEYPEVFGGAACLSTHWPGSLTQKNDLIPKAFATYLKANLPSPKNHKLYFDYGTATLDSLYEPHQLLVDKIIKEKGYTSENWVTRKFKGADHSEKAWSKRLHIPLQFLLGKEQ